MSKKPIKSSLFRFVTLRSPQVLEDKENAVGLILPNQTVKDNSKYYDVIYGVTDETVRVTNLNNTTPEPLDSKSDIKALSPVLYDFSFWLMRNKNQLSYESIIEKLPEDFFTGFDGINPAYLTNQSNPNDNDEKQESIVWDNLLYQTIKKTSSILREQLIQVLVTNEFLKAFSAYHTAMTEIPEEGKIVFTDQDEEEFRRRANASVVIEKEVLLSNKLDQVEAINTLPPVNAKILKSQLSVDTAQRTLSELKDTLKELDREEEIYIAENQKKYETDLAAHTASVKALIASTTPVIVDYTDPDTQAVTQVKTYPGLEIPQFSFDSLSIDFQSTGDTFAKTTSENFLSTKTQEILKSEKLSGYKDFSSIRKVIKDVIKEEEETILKSKAELEPKKAKIGGSEFTFSKANTNFLPYSFYGAIKKQLILDDIISFELTMSLSIHTGRSNASISSMNTKLVHSGGTEIVGTHIETDNNSLDSLLLRFTLPNDNDFVVSNDWSFEATYTFSNSDIVKLEAPVKVLSRDKYAQNLDFEGIGTLIDTNNETPVSITSFNGISNLGIADFLRVEQEICCYVPGEVSHIENILAKEYKEKSTRSLVSSEITTEQTRESEVENLTDTTSTERNELSSEVSSVIDKQNSTDIGASAFVNGGFGKNFTFGANTSFGSSSSTSTSNSNSQAQNYAQEVTERALERVVQKVSSKRTSRVLREFEENNKHGFDNTKGENHITGVYRWIDKIYENQIVNYGKRLMYEFSIPEPSRFLKEALTQAPEAEGTENGLLIPAKPKHPQSYVTDPRALFKPNHLTKENYQRFASYYNAEVNAYPDESLSVTGAFDSNYNKGGNEVGYYTSGTGEISIPENYQADSAIASINYMYHHWGNELASLSLLIGGKSYNYRDTTDIANLDIQDFPFPSLGGIQDKVAVAYESYDTGTLAISVSISCSLTQQAKQQWQNETFNAIMNAYYDRTNEYNDFMRAEEDLEPNTEGERMKFNPATNRKMEKRELKRCAIELLTNDTNTQLAKNRYSILENGIPKINANESLQNDVAVIKFFEQAFDWEIMAYTLYPYYYSDSNSWSDLVKEPEDGDPIFQSFMQSGMARVVVPVRPGFESAVSWYESTGEIWEGEGLVTDINDELYLSVAEEMLEPAGQPVGQSWKTQVPTSLTIVQGKSVFLDEGGLPCHSDCDETSQFGESNYVISGGTGSNASDGVGADIVGTDNNVV